MHWINQHYLKYLYFSVNKLIITQFSKQLSLMFRNQCIGELD